jgi:hypothetical protein
MADGIEFGVLRVKKGCQPRTNRVKDENIDLVTDSQSILDR